MSTRQDSVTLEFNSAQFELLNSIVGWTADQAHDDEAGTFMADFFDSSDAALDDLIAALQIRRAS